MCSIQAFSYCVGVLSARDQCKLEYNGICLPVVDRCSGEKGADLV